MTENCYSTKKNRKYYIKKRKFEDLFMKPQGSFEKPLIKRKLPPNFKPLHTYRDKPENTYNIKPAKHKTVTFQRKFPAGKGKAGNFTCTVTQITPKKHSEGLALLKIFPITIRAYKNPRSTLLLCAAHNWHKLTEEDIEEFYAAISYIYMFTSLRKNPSKLIKIDKFLEAERPRLNLRKQNGKYVRIDILPDIIERMKKIHRKMKKWNKQTRK